MRINHNIQALNAYRQLSTNQKSLGKQLEKLSSGLRITRAADDAAGLAISEKMRSQIRGLEVAERNAMDGISLVQTAEGALNEIQSMLQRTRELAVQSANGTLTSTDRDAIQQEVDQLAKDIDRIASSTNFNGRNLLRGESGTPGNPLAVTMQIGANTGETMSLNVNNMDAASLAVGRMNSGAIAAGTNVDKGLDVSSNQAAPNTSLAAIVTALDTVSVERSKLGAYQNRLEHSINNISTTRENMTAAESRIRDADMAIEMAGFTKGNIINQAATAMLAQANQLPQGILQLLQ